MAVPISTPLAEITLDNIEGMAELAQLGTDYDDPVRVVAFSPDNQLLACSTFKEIVIWDVHWREERQRIRSGAQALCFSADSDMVLVAAEDVLFFDVRTGEQQTRLKGHTGGTNALALSTDGEMLATGGADGLVRIGNLETRRLVGQFQHAQAVRAVAFSPDDSLLASISDTADSGRIISIWRIADGERIQTFSGKREKTLTFSPDGRLLVADGRVMELESNRTLYDIGERQVAFSLDSRLVASCHHNFPSVGLWNMETGEKITALIGHEDPVWQVAFSPDGRRLVSCSGSMNMSAALRGETDTSHDYSVRLWGVPMPEDATGTQEERRRRPLKRLGADEDTPPDDDNPLRDLFSRFGR